MPMKAHIKEIAMFLGMQNDLIAFVSETKEEIENLTYLPFTEIVETTDDYAFENGQYIKKDEDYLINKIFEAKSLKLTENIKKAKQTIENGYVVFKNAEFETNAQTVGDLTATMLMLEATHGESVEWLSKDDKIVELTIEDFGTLGFLIAQYKNTVWNDKYLNYKNLIEQSKTLEEINSIEINY